MFITPERCEQADFSNPEYVATTALLVQRGNPEGLSDYASVAESGATLNVYTHPSRKRFREGRLRQRAALRLP